MGYLINALPIVVILVIGLIQLKNYDWNIFEAAKPTADWKAQGEPYRKELASRGAYKTPSVGSNRDVYRKLTRSSVRHFSTRHEIDNDFRRSIASEGYRTLDSLQ